MTPYRAVLLALVVVGGVLTAAVPTSATGVALGANDDTEATGESIEDAGLTAATDETDDARPTAAANDTANNSTLGAHISSFMQSNAAEVDGAVETGMWTAAFNATDNRSVRAELVERRTSELRTELTDLQQRKRELLAEREEGNISEVAYKAKVSRLRGQINALQSAIDATSTRAEQTNASVESLDTLRSGSENLTGPEIASVARNTTGVGVDNGQGGPPGDVGNSGVGNGSDVSDVTDVGNGSSNDVGTGVEDTAGAPSDVGNGTDVVNETDAANETNTTDASNAGGPPDHAGASAVVGDSSETNAPYGSAPGSPGNEAGLGANPDLARVAMSTVAAAHELLDRASDALSVRTYAFDYALTAV